jgi:hypothetical protein
MGKRLMSMYRSPMSAWHKKIGLLFLFLVPISGCGGGGKPSGTVSGTVTYKGEPLPQGRVTFYGPNNQVASALIEEGGKYTATKVPLGEVKVAVDTPPAPSKAAIKAAKDKRRFERGVPIVLPENTISIPKKYENPELSGLSLTVKAGSQSYDIPLK